MQGREDRIGPHTEVADSNRLVRNPLVSVVMITYNHEPYIAQAIQGVVSQKAEFPIELVLGEDCSTDRTREIALDFQRRYPEMIRVLFSEKNVGALANFRRTILAARGKYMAFCEGDDWWHRKDKLQLQVPFFLSDDSLVCLSGGIRNISAHGEVLEPERQNNGTSPPTRIEYEDIIFRLGLQYPCTVMARTDVVRRLMLGDSLCNDHSQLMGDMPLFYELSQAGQMLHLSETLASYRHTPNSATRQSDPLYAWRFEISVFDIRYRALERYPLPGHPSRTSNVKAYFVRQMILRAAWLGDVTVARKQLRRLKSLGPRVGLKEIAYVVLAYIPFPRRPLKLAYMKMAPLLERTGLNLIKRLAGQAVFPPSDKK